MARQPLDSKAAIAHAAAIRMLERYKSTGEPFVLFLSSWQFDHARELRALDKIESEIAEAS